MSHLPAELRGLASCDLAFGVSETWHTIGAGRTNEFNHARGDPVIHRPLDDPSHFFFLNF